MPHAFFLAITLIATACAIYVNIPYLVVRLNKVYNGVRVAETNLKAIKKPDWLRHFFTNKTGGTLSLNRLEQFLRQSGDYRPEVINRYLQHIALLIILPFIAAVVLNLPMWQAVLVALASISLKNGSISRQTRQRKEALERSFFKIYRFIDSQILAGIKATDVLKGLHESIDDPMVQPALIRFSARFSLTLDLDQAMFELQQSLDGKDIETLGTHLRQVISTGMAGRSFQRTEELLFSRYFSILQRQSVTIHNRLLFSAILMMLPTVLLFLMPVLYEAMHSLTLIFG